MEVKGELILQISNFVKEKFGEEKYHQWIETQEPDGKKFHEKGILSSAWYPLTTMYTGGLKVMCDLFYNKDLQGAWECGVYSASKSLSGVYKIFIYLGTKEYKFVNSAAIFKTVARPCRVEHKLIGKNIGKCNIYEYSDMSEYIEHHIGGYIESGLKLIKCRNAKVEITKSMAKGDQSTEYSVSWND